MVLTYWLGKILFYTTYHFHKIICYPFKWCFFLYHKISLFWWLYFPYSKLWTLVPQSDFINHVFLQFNVFFFFDESLLGFHSLWLICLFLLLSFSGPETRWNRFIMLVSFDPMSKLVNSCANLHAWTLSLTSLHFMLLSGFRKSDLHFFLLFAIWISIFWRLQVGLFIHLS